jgi:apolipoprotein N-acyltransferase
VTVGRPAWWRWLAAPIGGLAVAASLPPWGVWPLAVIGIGLLAVAPASDRRQRASSSALFALCWLGPATAWMLFLTVPGHIAAVLVFTVFHAVAGALAPTGPMAALGRAGAHTLAEALRMSVPFGGVPLASFGISQAGGPVLGVARLGGVVLITLVVLTIGFHLPALATAVHRRRRPSPHALWPLAVTAAIVVGSSIAPSGHDLDEGRVRIAAVQGGGRQGTSALEVPSRQVTEAHLAATRSIPAGGDLDLVVWPENAIDVDGVAFAESAVAAEIAAEARRLGVPFAVGVTEDAEFVYPDVDDGFVNSQYSMLPTGEVVDRYVKVVRVPYGEYVPLRSALEALGAPVGQIPSDAVAGRGPAVIDVPDVGRLAVAISWEVFFGRRSRDGVGSGGEILVNPTNGASYTWTILQTQQVASSRLRAVETGRWVVQVAPTGFSAFVSPDGEVFDRTDIGERAVIVRDVVRRGGDTVYRMSGDAPPIVLAALAMAVAVLSNRRSTSPARR